MAILDVGIDDRSDADDRLMKDKDGEDVNLISLNELGTEGGSEFCWRLILEFFLFFRKEFGRVSMNILANPLSQAVPIKACLELLERKARWAKKKAIEDKQKFLKVKKDLDEASVEIKNLRIVIWKDTKACAAKRNQLKEDCK
ncbi:hypothetical protein COCNU_scaffold004486G000080 [Cocos nucifera]|nr:hypothetical protein [Cocos nucifera]